jgi:hypothetical protein
MMRRRKLTCDCGTCTKCRNRDSHRRLKAHGRYRVATDPLMTFAEWSQGRPWRKKGAS